MGQLELESALLREGDEKAHEIWRRIEAEVEQLRNETERVLKQERQVADARRAMEGSRVLSSARAEASQRVQRARVQAENALAERLKLLAQTILEKIALEGGLTLFRALASEIPDSAEFDWCRVRLHPRDKTAAEELFPAAELSCSAQISGGIIVEGPGGQVLIDNSLEQRLESLWPRLLPDLFKEVRQSVVEDETVG